MMTASSSPPESNAPSAPSPQPDRPPKLVIADDEADSLKALTVYLTAHGFEVIPTSSGEEALRKVKEHQPDLAIIDVMMPRLNGFQVARTIKFDKHLKRIPLILLTARTAATDRILGERVGADEYITKPFEPSHLLERIRFWLMKSAKTPHASTAGPGTGGGA